MNSPLYRGDGDLPQFDLATENEILKLKLKMEFGAECTSQADGIPHAVVNEFLKSVYAFEQMFRKTKKTIAVYERVGRPAFQKEERLTDVELPDELKRLRQLMARRRVQLDVLGVYPDRQIYRFITEEFFSMQKEDVDMPGFVHHFCYEDFHPNHELEIRERALELLTLWFNRYLSVEEWPLMKKLVSTGGIEITQQHALIRMNEIWNAYKLFENCEYKIVETQYMLDGAPAKGRGHVKGNVRFDAELESCERIHVEGAFLVELVYDDRVWIVSYFELPSLRW